jgi:hypothetical protein
MAATACDSTTFPYPSMVATATMATQGFFRGAVENEAGEWSAIDLVYFDEYPILLCMTQIGEWVLET